MRELHWEEHFGTEPTKEFREKYYVLIAQMRTRMFNYKIFYVPHVKEFVKQEWFVMMTMQEADNGDCKWYRADEEGEPK
jgi:hypothetical protein